jgi:hypothetical protein
MGLEETPMTIDNTHSMAVLVAEPGGRTWRPNLAANLADEIRVQCFGSLSRAQQRAPAVGRHNSEKLPHLKMAVEFGLLVAVQLAKASQLGQPVHARHVTLTKAHRHKVLSGSARQLLLAAVVNAGK